VLLLEGVGNVLEAGQRDLAMSARYSEISDGAVVRAIADGTGACDHR